MKTLMDETIELHRMNVQLMDTLAVIAARFLEISAKYHLQIEGLDSLAFLFGKASRLCEEMGTPCRKNPIIVSDDRYHQNGSDGEVPPPPRRLCQRDGTRFRVSNVGT
jgi:hypothetical protein